MTAVTLYLRKSTKDGGRSADRQRAELLEAADREGLTIADREYIDPDFSASRYARRVRPDYAALLAAIRGGEVQTLGLYEASRGARDLTVWSQLLDLCRTRRVKVWVSTHGRLYDLARRRDWRALADEGVAAADEAEIISERTLSGKRKAAREGTPAGRLVYGFAREYGLRDGKRVLLRQIANAEQAPIVTEIVARVAAGDESLAAIARDLNDRGVVAPQGGRWYSQTVRAVVLNPSYAGKRVHQGEVFGPAAWAPIVDVALWERACARLSAAGRTWATSTALAHWLTGVLACGGCGAMLASGVRSGGCARVYRCKRCKRVSVSAPTVEAVVERAILGRLARGDGFPSLPRPDDGEALAAADHVRVLRERLDAHYAEAAAGRLSAPGLAAVEAMLLRDIKAAETRAKRAAIPAALREIADADPLELARRWQSLPPGTRRNVVRVLAELVVAPTATRGRTFDPGRLGGSRWVGDARTWAEIWTS